MPITLSGDTGITTPTYGGADTSEYLVPVTSFKNRIINGAMVIDQRNAGAVVSTPSTSTVFGTDRWAVVPSQANKLTMQQSTVAPTGFKNSLLITSSSAYSIIASDYFILRQSIEGFNVADFNLGSASAITFTLSFWVRSSLTGTFGGSFRNASANRSYPFTYTISASNTWEYKTVTIAGDTTGTWATDNTTGIEVDFSLGVGSDRTGTAGSWAGANYLSPTGATSVVGTNGATFYITGVQLEVGSTATSFDYRPYGTEFALCQRYYQSHSTPNNYGRINTSNDTYRSWSFLLPVTMRATPTGSSSGGDASVTWNGMSAAFAWGEQNVGNSTTGKYFTAMTVSAEL